ncbi:hypothetical protein [Mycoplasmopsis columbina]|nr:hypothetical protein [Mycoplasmopsis columbina]
MPKAKAIKLIGYIVLCKISLLKKSLLLNPLIWIAKKSAKANKLMIIKKPNKVQKLNFIFLLICLSKRLLERKKFLNSKKIKEKQLPIKNPKANESFING